MFVVAAVTDAVAEVMEQRSGFELHARLDGQVVQRLELVKEQNTEFAHVLVFEVEQVSGWAAGETGPPAGG